MTDKSNVKIKNVRKPLFWLIFIINNKFNVKSAFCVMYIYDGDGGGVESGGGGSEWYEVPFTFTSTHIIYGRETEHK